MYNKRTDHVITPKDQGVLSHVFDMTNIITVSQSYFYYNFMCRSPRPILKGDGEATARGLGGDWVSLRFTRYYQY